MSLSYLFLNRRQEVLFIEAVDQEVKSRNVEGPLVFTLPDMANMKMQNYWIQ